MRCQGGNTSLPVPSKNISPAATYTPYLLRTADAHQGQAETGGTGRDSPTLYPSPQIPSSGSTNASLETFIPRA